MNLQTLREQFPESAKDIKLNLETILSPEVTPGLTINQTLGIALACAYATKELKLAKAILLDFELNGETQNAAKGAASIMAMNNVYYRTMHLLGDSEISKMPAKLRMNILSRPGIPKVDFELMSLAVSALSGCGMCIKAHAEEVKKQGISPEGIHSAIRIASVMNAASLALSLGPDSTSSS